MVLSGHASDSVTDMTIGNARELILRFSVPLVFGNLFQQLYSIVDAVVVGRFVGVDALASIGCISWVCWLINAFLRDTANAFSIAASIRVGRQNSREFLQIVWAAIVICAVLGIPVTGLLLAAVPLIVDVLSVQPNVVEMTRQYLTVFILTIPAGLIYNIAASLLRAYGNSRITLSFPTKISPMTTLSLF